MTNYKYKKCTQDLSQFQATLGMRPILTSVVFRHRVVPNLREGNVANVQDASHNVEDVVFSVFCDPHHIHRMLGRECECVRGVCVCMRGICERGSGRVCECERRMHVRGGSGRVCVCERGKWEGVCM